MALLALCILAAAAWLLVVALRPIKSSGNTYRTDPETRRQRRHLADQRYAAQRTLNEIRHQRRMRQIESGEVQS